MSANDKSTEQQQQQQQPPRQDQVTDLPEQQQQQPSAEQAEDVKGGVLYIGTAPAGYTGKVVPVMQTATGDSSNIT